MPVSRALVDFRNEVAQCDTLLANAHRTTSASAFLFPQRDREQITEAAFLNMFIAWEAFLEAALLNLMLGSPTIGGGAPIRRVLPQTLADARSMVTGTLRYFDYANHQNLRLLANLYFDNGYPFEPHLSSMQGELDDMKTMRNSCAHISASTHASLSALATRINGQPVSRLSVYKLLTMVDPRYSGGETVMETYKNILLTAAELIANG